MSADITATVSQQAHLAAVTSTLPEPAELTVALTWPNLVVSLSQPGQLTALLSPSQSVTSALSQSVQVTQATWPYFVAYRDSDTTPTQVGTVTSPVSGRVFAYTLGGVVRYRLVPDVYVNAHDAFYSGFSGGVLSGFIVARDS